MEIEFFEKEPAEVKAFITRGFEDDHLEKTNTVRKKFAISLKDNNELVAAGRGSVFGRDLYISELMVSLKHRKKNYGSAVIKEISKHAKKHNCSVIFVDTYDYQAPEFYVKNGFIEIARIDGYRNKHSRIFLKKEV